MKPSVLLGLAASTLISKTIFKNLMGQNLRGKTVLITGGTTGLGFELLRQLLDEGCRVATCARNSADLQTLKENFPDVFTMRCDVGKKEEVETFVTETIKHFDHIDIVINNAGIIMVAPMEGFIQADYEHAMDVMYWGMVHTTFAVLEHMKSRKQGQIVNITSVGGKVSIPHLLPYSAAKFAAVGFSEGTTSELRQHNIFVTTVIPGLMRTGSYVNALFQEDNKLMYKLFSAISTAPGITISAKKAAEGTIDAIKRKNALVVLGLPAKVLIELHHFFPQVTTQIMKMTSAMLPGENLPEELVKGQEIQEKFPDAEVPVLKNLGQKAHEDYQEQRAE